VRTAAFHPGAAPYGWGGANVAALDGASIDLVLIMIRTLHFSVFLHYGFRRDVFQNKIVVQIIFMFYTC
jgi:hypothetical protein